MQLWSKHCNIFMCNFLLKYNKTNLFLKQSGTGDEKWILYNNMKCQR